MPFVLAQIRLGVKVLKPWYGFVIRDVATLTDVFAELSAGKLDNEPPLAEELRSSPATCSAGNIFLSGLLLISQHKDTKMLHDIKYKPFTILFELSVF